MSVESSEYRLNKDLFSNHYLSEHLPETEAWNEPGEEELRSVRREIVDLWNDQKETAPKRNESQLEAKFIRPMFRILDIPFEVEETVKSDQRRPDYGFFASEADANDAYERRDEGGDFYKNAIAVADAKRWGRSLDTRGESKEDYTNPSFQIDQYLRKTETQWGVLTTGEKWRLYYKPTSHKIDSYYEVDLPTILEDGNLKDFKYFYLFFRHDAFLPDASGDCFLDGVYGESNIFARELGEDLQNNIYEAINLLAEGFLHYPDNELSEAHLDQIHSGSLIYLYRLIFILYAEAEGRELLDTDNPIYENRYSLNTRKQEIADELDSGNPSFHKWENEIWSKLDKLFQLIDKGSKSRGIPKEDLYIPAYNGGLFNTDPFDNENRLDKPVEEYDDDEFLAAHPVGDAHLAKVIDLLTRSNNGNGGGKIFVDYSSLDIRHLGSIYEGLLEYQLNIADEPLGLENGEYVPANEGTELVVSEGDLYLTTDSGERKATGSYYTPEAIVEYIVGNTLDPLVEEIREDLVGYESYDEGGFAEEFANRIFDLKILDPAMGSGHFLTNVVDFLAREIIDAQEKQLRQQDQTDVVDDRKDIFWARRQVAQRCIYGVDVNPLAVELAKVSLWLRTLAAKQPLAFLDHHLKTGNSLVGSNIEDIDNLESDTGGRGPNTTLADFGVARKGTIEQLMRIYQDFIAIENKDLADVKEMESKYSEFERNKVRQRLEKMANVHTAKEFRINTPTDAFEQMATAIEDDKEWQRVEQKSWFEEAQQLSSKYNFFHWRLEYPEVFYSIEGDKLSNPGFDVVLGNPPYMRIQTIRESSPSIGDYYVDQFESATGNFDIYVNFTEQGYDLLRHEGLLGYIEPHKFFQGEFGKGLRKYLSNEKAIYQITSFGHKQVWDQVSVYTCILILRKTNNSTFKYAETDPELLLEDQTIEHRKISAEYNEEPWVFHTEQVKQILDVVEEAGPTLEETTEIFVGLQTSADRIYLLERTGDQTKEGLVEVVDQVNGDTWHLEPDLLKPFLKGEDVHRYEPLQPRYWVIFPYFVEGENAEFVEEELLKTEYPKTYNYLKQHEVDLRGRENGKMDHDRWYDYVYPKNLTDFKHEKIVTPEISYGPNFTYDADGTYHTTKVYGVLIRDGIDYSPEYVLSVLNSPVLWFFLTNTGYTLRGGYFTFKTNYLNPFSIPSIPTDSNPEHLETCLQWYDKHISGEADQSCPLLTDDLRLQSATTHEFVKHLVRTIIGLKKEHEELNLHLLDYFGNYSDGQQLGEISQYQPPMKVGESLISETKKTRGNLRIGNIRVTESENKLTVEITARYKPDNPEDHETDQWGYTESEFQPALEFIGLSETESSLIREFVPVAVEKGGGFANFRENATKTNSLVDRLEKLCLPSQNDVKDGLERYLSTRDHSEQILNQIETSDEIINKIIYGLYGFGDDQIKLIDSESPE